MNRAAVIVTIVLGLSAAAATAQQSPGPTERRERPRQRDRGPQPGAGAEGQRPPRLPIITALDADGDGVLSAEEIAKSAESLKKLDKDGDGKLSAEEFLPARPGGFGGPGGPRTGGPAGREPGARRTPGGPPDGPAGPPDDRAGAGEAAFESSPLPKDDAEKKILAVLDDMDKNARRGMMSVPRDDGRYLRLLAESLNPKNVVEIGTSHGYSAVWLCLALRTTGGKLTTFEIDAQRAALARANFKRAGVESLVTLVEGDAHEEVSKLKDPIDLLFLDADKEGYLDYLEKLLPLVRPGGLIVAHNMNARQADPRYVKAITTNPQLETLFVNLGSSDIGVTLKKR
ncbi:MAG: class I SAM-dependent methyltransferase [Planctomycetes bacterium]|nr:class I SAM-dependent methyltransferase [Planctomycetota bacterium]